MLRWAIVAVVTVGMVGQAFAADMPDASRRYHGKPPKDETGDLLFTPTEPAKDADAASKVVPHLPTAICCGPLLLGSATLPGYYGSNNSYEYQGPYYGGPNNNFRTRLPYACGVLGYC